MPEHKPARHPLGSRRRWLTSLLLLCFTCVPLYVIPRIVFPDIAFLVFLCAIPGWIAVLGIGLDSGHFSDRDWHVPWLSDIGVNFASGSAEEEGIYFQEWFRRRFVSWRGIARLEYWPDRSRRIDLLLFNRMSPVVFTVEDGSDTVDYISRKLEETWPGRSTFLVSYHKPHEGEPGFTSKLTDTLGLGRNVLSMLLVMSVVYGYAVIQFRVRLIRLPTLVPESKIISKSLLVVWSVFLILWAVASLSRKLRNNAPSKSRAASPEPTEKLRE
jgi:hypothetical protein